MRGVVLVVEDNDEVRSALEQLFTDAGYEVASAPDGARGLALLSYLRRPAVVVVDERMPVMSGREFIAYARRDARTQKIPIVMLSGDHTASSICGLYGFVRKPCDSAELVALVARAMSESE